jgi:hypothetical protein
MSRSAVLLAFLLASPVAAQPAPSSATPSTNAPKGMTLEHFVAQHSRRIMSADTNGDGRVSRAEMAAMPVKPGSDPSQRFDRMDANHDGYLDQNEIRAAFTRHFQRMDLNGDGILTPDERKARRKGHGNGSAAPVPSHS